MLLYEPFNYTVGANLGGTDPDGAGPTAGTPIGQTNLNTGGGTWYARGTQSNYQSPNDTVLSSGSLSYAGLAASVGNSVSYGSEIGSVAPYADSIDIPGNSIASGSLYASFIVRIKTTVVSPTATTFRHSPAGLIFDTSEVGNAGGALDGQSGTAVAGYGSLFWMRRDPDDATLNTTNFSPGKSSGDGIGPGATGPSSGWQRSVTAGNIESNQFGDVDGQPVANFNDPNSYQTYFVVLKYEFDAMASTNGQVDTVSMWMNPGSGTLGSVTGEADASAAASGNLGSYYAAVDAFGTATSDVTSISSFALIGHRQSTDSSIAVDFDELRIGTTWQDVTPTAAAPMDDADFDGDGDVDGDDFLTWQRGLGTAGSQMQGNANNSGLIDGADLAIWRSQFGPAAVAAASAVPEPASLILAAASLLLAAVSRRRCRSSS